MVRLKELTGYLDELLNIAAVPGDDSNNGLQVEASETVNKAVFGVDAGQALFEAARAQSADFVFVHHGLSWGGEPRRFTGVTASRLKYLFNNGISLYAAHLPLDAHPQLGHNALLADMVKLRQRYYFADYHGCAIACGGVLPEVCFVDQLVAKLEPQLHCKAVVFGDQGRKLEKVGIISGGGGLDGLLACIAEEMDCYVTGEMGHVMYHLIRESGITVVQLGHYHSEVPGVRAVMRKVEKKFSIDCEFIDIPTGL
ncbi:MAG: Nif3-like dinuclear metal center hexameric protein [Victivallaceae bacterium]|nr:Nif3-like dinuclear metal center hexameric protein [Victivallaceae bacterium]